MYIPSKVQKELGTQNHYYWMRWEDWEGNVITSVCWFDWGWGLQTPSKRGLYTLPHWSSNKTPPRNTQLGVVNTAGGIPLHPDGTSKIQTFLAVCKNSDCISQWRSQRKNILVMVENWRNIFQNNMPEISIHSEKSLILTHELTESKH